MHSYLPLLPYIIALILAAIVYVASQRVAPAEPVTPVATTPAVDSEPEPAEQDDDTPSPFVLYSYYLASRMAALGLGTGFDMGDTERPDRLHEALLCAAQAIGQAEGAMLRQDAMADVPLLSALEVDTKVWALLDPGCDCGDSTKSAASPAADAPPTTEVQP